MKKHIFTMVIILFLNLIGSNGVFASGDDDALAYDISSRISVQTFDGLYDTSQNIGIGEGAVIINLNSEADLELFRNLSTHGKLLLMNSVAQSHWGDYLGAKVCYVEVKYNLKSYAIATVKNGQSIDDLSLSYKQDGDPNFTIKSIVKDPTVSNNTTNNNESTQIKENIKRKTLDEMGVIIKNNTMIPAYSFIKSIGGILDVDTKTKAVSIQYKDIKIQGAINSKYVKVNGVASSYSVPLNMVNGKLMIPIELVKKSLKGSVAVSYISKDLKNEYKGNYISDVTVTLPQIEINIKINDLYEVYKDYLNKDLWIVPHNTLIYNSKGEIVNQTVKNLSKIKVLNIGRELETYIFVDFLYKNRTYKAKLKSGYFSYDFQTIDPKIKYNFTENVWYNIENNVVKLGMTKDMVYLSIGMYDRHRVENYADGTRDLWAYDYSGHTKYLYFINDVLQTISE